VTVESAPVGFGTLEMPPPSAPVTVEAPGTLPRAPVTLEQLAGSATGRTDVNWETAEHGSGVDDAHAPLTASGAAASAMPAPVAKRAPLTDLGTILDAIRLPPVRGPGSPVPS
jgi:hypothetical protein